MKEKKQPKPKKAYLLYYKHDPIEKPNYISHNMSQLIGVFTTKKQANYYCKELTKYYRKKNNTKDDYCYVHPWYVNTSFYFMKANGESVVPEYDPKK